mgnify:CR=1 FL=1
MNLLFAESVKERRKLSITYMERGCNFLTPGVVSLDRRLAMRAMLEVKGIGENSSPPLLFVHGAWHGAWCWKPLMDYLAKKGFTSYTFDLPGHGTRKSEGVVGLGIMDYVAEVESAMGELAPVKPILIGHSMGGLIVQKFLEKNEALASIPPCVRIVVTSNS